MTTTGTKPRILCIDDKAENLKIRTMMLDLFGCETIAAADYDQSMQVLEHTEVDLLLIDYHLADDRTGEEIARDVRRKYPEIPLVMPWLSEIAGNLLMLTLPSTFSVMSSSYVPDTIR